MSKYLVLFNSNVTATDQMANSTLEQVQASMAEWMSWQQEAVKKVGFEWGLPVQAAANITLSSVQESQNLASGYCIMDGDKELITELLQSHPHLKGENTSIDLLEMIAMTGK